MTASGSAQTLWSIIELMVVRQWAALAHALPYWGLAAALCVAIGTTPGAVGGRALGVRRVLLVCATLAALWHGASLRWISDDAFISFRYADNLVRGLGLTFNPSERVEGYTNFLWTMLMAAGIALGATPAPTSMLFSLASLGALPLLTERIIRRLRPDAAPAPVPFAALAVAASPLLGSYGTSGLETMFATALVAFALERALAGAAAMAGFAGVLATLAHPDHGLLYAGLGVALLVARRPFRELIRYALPFVLLFVPYFLWRYSYYGDLVPNTFHTKSGDRAYFSQGGVYLLAFAIGSGAWALAPTWVRGIIAARSRTFQAFLAFGVLPYLLYVAKIGGDFMYGRLLCVVLPTLLVTTELAVMAWLDCRHATRAVLGVAALALSAVPHAVLGERGADWLISDEGRFYKVTSLSPLKIDSYYFNVAHDMRRFLTRLPVDPLIAFDCVGMTGYFSHLPIVDRWGLTDAHVARQHVVGRGRPGHEKRAHPGYLLERGVHFSDVPVFPLELSGWTEARVGQTRFYVVQHDPAVMEPLARRHVRLPSPARELMRIGRARTAAVPAAQRACEAWVLDEVYVQRWGDDAARRTLYAEMLSAASNVPLAEVEQIGFDGVQSHTIDTATALHFDPGAGDLVDARGAPVTQLLRQRGLPEQSDVFGHEGWFLDTYAQGAGDGLTATMRSQPFELRGDVLELRVGGGRDAAKLRVDLRIDGRVAFTATGCLTELLGRRLWFIKPFRGKQAVLEIHDQHVGGWGHLLVDEVRQWLPRTQAAPAPAN